MNKFTVMMVTMLAMAGLSCAVQAEEVIQLKKSDDGSWKMKVTRKNEKEWEGTYQGKTYILRGDTAFSSVKDSGDYTVYGTLAPDGTFITTSRVERIPVPASDVQEKRVNDYTRPVYPPQTKETDNTRPAGQSR